ncbi:MAG TPA: DUF4131 domain-containing protein, partial [Actinomycetota bacterium]
MSAWLAPALAAVFWAGLLAQPWLGDVVDPWVWLSVGGGLLGAALALAPEPAEGTGSLERVGLVEHDPRAAVAPAPTPHHRPVSLPLALALIGAVLLAVGWGSVHEHRVQGAVVAHLAPASVTVEGPLRVDPSAERDRWSAIMDVRSVTWEGGAAAVRETVWLSGRDQPPDAVRGDVVRVSGSLQPLPAALADRERWPSSAEPPGGNIPGEAPRLGLRLGCVSEIRAVAPSGP